MRYTIWADVHVDAIPIEALKKEKKIFLDHISTNQQDLIVIVGDYFHSKIPANSPYMKEAVKLFAEVCRICKANNTKLRIIRGTESHDNDQLDILGAMDVALDIDLRIINKVEEEELFSGFKVLYLPEEYLNDMDAYYHQYFDENDKYSMILGHGLVDKAAFIAHIQESEETRTSAPIFKLKKLHEICLGPIYFGHIHTHMLFNRFRYVSSYSRYAHGEESAKGFMAGVYDITKQDFMDMFIENTLARKYTTIKIKEDSELFDKEPQYIVSEALEIATQVLEDFVRIEIDIPESYEKSNLLVAMLNETIKNRKIKLKINTTHKERMVAKIKEKISEEMIKYSIIFDKNVRPEEKLSAYIKIKNGVHIPVEEIDDILYG